MLDIYATFSAACGGDPGATGPLLHDGMHPNQAGSDVIADGLYELLIGSVLKQ